MSDGHWGPCGFGYTEDANAVTAKQTGGKVRKCVHSASSPPRAVLALLRITLSCPLRGSHLGKSQWFLYSSGSQTGLLQSNLGDLLRHPFLGPSLKI